MPKYQYKIVVVRTSQNVFYSSKEVEAIINQYADNGWRLISSAFHESNLSYELIFEKED